MRMRWGIVAAILAIGASVGAADIRAWTVLEPPVIPFHRQAEFSIVVESPEDRLVDLPEDVERFGGLIVKDVHNDIENIAGGRVRQTQTYVLEAVFAGDYTIASVEITASDEETFIVPSPALRVRDLTDAERALAEKFNPNAEPFSPPLPWRRRWETWAALALAAAVVAAGLWWYWRRRPEMKAAEALQPPWERAYNRLHALDALHLPESGDYEPYYIELSSILRHYIEDRLDLHAPERTTPEFLAEAAVSGRLSQEHQQLVAGFLRHCDRVKFARYEPRLEEMETAFTSVLRFVDETVPQPEQETDGEVAC